MKSTEQGLTLLGLIVSLAVGSITLHAGGVSMLQVAQTAKLNSIASTLHTDLFIARSEAITRNSRVTIEAHNAQWEQGWKIYVDDNDNASHDSGEPLLRQRSGLPNGVTLRGNRPVRRYLSFVGSGLTRSIHGGMQFGTLLLCTDNVEISSGSTRAIIISMSGRPRVSRSSKDLKGRAC